MIRTQTLRADKYALCPGEINVGTRGSYGEEKLRFEFSSEWDGLTKKAVFYPVRGKPVAVLLDNKEDIDVPYEITRMSGQAKLVVSGSLIGDGTAPQKIITVTAILNVRFTQDDKGASAKKITPDLYDQFLEDAAKVIADKLREAVESGEFKGDAGEDGITPHIGTNGNWYIGTSDTGIHAQGERGLPGRDGTDGVDGTDGEDGITPHIGDNGHWYIGDTDTGIVSRGDKGDKGDSGVFVKTSDGEEPDDSDNVMIDATETDGEISIPDGISLNGRVLRLICGTSFVGNPVTLPEGGGSGGGADGYSPTVSFTDITGGRKMTVTDVNGDHETDIMDGVDGKDGTNGTNGVDGTNGTDGRGITSIVRTAGDGSAGTVDTYTITYTDETTTTFSVRNGANGTDGTNGTNGTDGRGIVSIERTSGTGAAGTTDTYTITYTDSTTSTFTVVNGADGTGAEITVDSAVSDTSENPVQNKVIKAYIDGLIGDIDTAIASINAVIGGNTAS
mgnify:FL=1